MTQWVQKLWLSCIVVVLLTKTCASSSHFVANIEIDADFTDADNDLQSPRMTDLDKELRTLFGHLEGFLELELESVWPANCNLVARVIVTVTSNVSVDDMDNLLETLQCAPVTIGGETYNVYDAVRSTRDLEVCVIGGEQQLVTFDGWRGYLPTPCPYLAGSFNSDANPECNVQVFPVNSDEPVEGRYFVKAVTVLVISPRIGIFYTDVEAISKAGQDPLAEVWRLNFGTVGPNVLITYDPVNRTALLTLPACNITVAFTSTNDSELTIVVPPDLIDKRFKFPSAMCFAPPDVLTNDYHPYLLGLYGVVQQKDPGSPLFRHQCCQAACEKAFQLMRNSCGEDPMESIAACGPILAKHSLAKCLPAPMDTFNTCLRYVCQNDVNACKKLRTLADGTCPELGISLILNC